MAWRTLLIQSEGRLSIRKRQLICANAEGERCVALEEVAVVMVDTPEASFSSALLSELCQEGVAVVVCDARHTPCGMMLPLHQHSRQSAVAAEQVGWSRPFQKRVWQALVRAKIVNQAAMLEIVDENGAQTLRKMAALVDSGDSANQEARAARFYLGRLFGPAFVRQGHRTPNPNRTNSALNYGYAVARAAAARAIVAHGLLPCLGVHHNSQLNAFNLADDLVEPLRPVVDSMVRGLQEDWGEEDSDELNRADRVFLARAGACRLRIQEEVHTLIQACDLMVESLVRAGREKNARLLLLPELVFDEEDGAQP